jgi:hypothetical protein
VPLKPDQSITASVAVVALVYSIHNRGMPTLADQRTIDPQDQVAMDTLDKQRKQNTWAAAGVVSAVSLLAKDPTIFILGGAAVIGLDWASRHAELVDPLTGTVRDIVRPADVGQTQETAPDQFDPALAAVG